MSGHGNGWHVSGNRPALVIALLFAIGLVVVFALETGDEDADQHERRTITADGMAEQRVPPDVAIVRLGVTSSRTTAQAATAETSRAMRHVISTLRSRGVEQLQTAPVRVQRAPPRTPDGCDRR